MNNLNKLLSDGVYVIPKNQRGYSWTSKEIDDLFVDMELVREKLGVNWSFALRDFIQDKVAELKPQAQAKMNAISLFQLQLIEVYAVDLTVVLTVKHLSL